MNVLERGQWLLRRHAKRGPAKSPDYVAYDGAGQISVVECKGTQTSRTELWNALARGSQQKTGLRALGGQQIIHQLAVGAFVPQHEKREQALLAVIDPDKADSREELRKYTGDQIRRGAEQVSYAKELAMFEMTATAATLVHETESPEDVEAALAIDRDRPTEGARSIDNNVVRIQRDYRWVTPVVRPNGTFRGVRFSGELPVDRLGELRRYRVRRDLPDNVIEDVEDVDWNSVETDRGVTLKSPLGAEYSIQWLE